MRLPTNTDLFSDETIRDIHQRCIHELLDTSKDQRSDEEWNCILNDAVERPYDYKSYGSYLIMK